jgi:hypothetical protein
MHSLRHLHCVRLICVLLPDFVYICYLSAFLHPPNQSVSYIIIIPVVSNLRMYLQSFNTILSFTRLTSVHHLSLTSVNNAMDMDST